MRSRLHWVLAFAVALVMLTGCDWLQPGYDSGGSRGNPSEPGLTPSSVASLVRRFTISATDRSYRVPIVAGASAFATSLAPSTGSARIEQFDRLSGAAGWSTTLATGVDAVSDPSSDGTSAFVATFVEATGAGTLFEVSLSTGAVEWTKALPTSGYVVPSLRVDQGRVFVTLWQRGATYGPWGTVTVLAVDTASDATDWSYSNSANVVQSIGTVVAQNLVVVAFDCCARPGVPQGIPTTAVLNESDGSVRAVTQNELLTVAADQLAYGQAVDPNNNSETVAVDPTNGTVKWTATPQSQFAVSSSSMVFASSSGALQAADPTTGSTQWTSSAPTGVSTSSDPVVAGGVVYVMTSNGQTNKLRAVDATNGTAISATNTGAGAYSDPVVAAGTIYVTQAGSIAAFAPQ